MHIIHSFLNTHNLACSAIGAAIYAVLSEIIRRLARQIRHQRRKHYKASPEYRNYQAMLRQQGRDRLAHILAETRDPWAAPSKAVRK